MLTRPQPPLADEYAVAGSLYDRTVRIDNDIDAIAAPAARRSLLPDEAVDALRPGGVQRSLMTVDVVDADSLHFDRAVRIAIVNGANNESNAFVALDVAAPLDAGDVCLARFWARCTESMTGEGQTNFVVTAGDDVRLVEQRVGIGPHWSEYFVPFRVAADVAASRVAFLAGYDRQTIEIGGVEVVNLGPDVALDALPRTRLDYVGRAPDAAWRVAAAERIERFRKGDLTVRVVDARGRPVPGARVEVALRRHAFGFGTCVDAALLMGDSSDSATYREIIGELFNRATFENDMKWPQLEGGVPPVLDAAVAWLRDRAIDVRGHTLVWPSWRWLPKSLRAFADRPVELRRRTAEHIAETCAHFRGKLIQWDVVNEPFSEHDLIDALGGPGVIVDWFELARAADPTARLFLNDYGIFDSGRGPNVHREHFHETLAFLRSRGAPLDGVGIQSHFSSDLPSPEQLLATLDRFAEFGLPIESTELSLNFDDESLQADYLRDYLMLLFSHQHVEGVTLWGIWSKRHWRPAAGIWDDAWREKPAARAMRTLLTETWSTRDRGDADASGTRNVRGFCGTYDVVATLGDRCTKTQVTLGRDGATATVVLGDDVAEGAS